jgi:hypothetical protein
MKRTLAAAFVAVALAGCRQSVDLDAVRAMAKTAADARASYDALATDYYDSCMRRLQLDSIASAAGRAVREVGSGLGLPAQPASRAAPPVYPPGLAPADLAAALPADVAARAGVDVLGALDKAQFLKLVDRDDFDQVEALFTPAQRAALEARAPSIEHGRVYGCRQAAVSSEQWRKTNGILVGYFLALGDLAGSSSGDDRYGIGALATQLHKTDAIGDPAPFAGAVTGLIRMHFDAKRKEAIADFVTRGDGLVADAVTRLSAAARKHYVANQLRQERDSLETFLLLNRKYASPGADAFAVYGYAKGWKEERQAVDDREVAANAYAASLAKLRAAHKQILDAARANDLQSALAVAVALSTDVRGDIDKIDKAFSKKK